ncbi:MAG: 50S ribosomal protein L23 [Chloroflexi bacterium]|nr:50S ribosomal protein L23 [Chloroflexota bacterium]
MELLEVLRRPVITEKSTSLQEVGKYAFEVASRSNKILIKAAVEKAFNVKVTAVNVMTVRGKTKVIGRRKVRMPSWKKAIVTLKEGEKIELFEGV